MKTSTKLAAFIGLSVLAAGQASANLILNGGFETPDPLNLTFTSAYGNVTGTANGLATGGDDPVHNSGEGLYAVGNDPDFNHSAFTTAGPHSGANMMIVNGSTIEGKNVWTGKLSPDMTPGVTYEFSAWVMNVYHDDDPTHEDAQLQFSIGGNVLVGRHGHHHHSLTGAGDWQEFTALYTPSTTGELPTSVDLKFNYYANDFALDDISLTVAVPEPTTIIAGALLLLPFGLGAVRTMCRKQIA